MRRSDAAQRYAERNHRRNVVAFARPCWRATLNGLSRASFMRTSRGEPWRNIAAGVWPAGGSLILGNPTEHLPPELTAALNRHRDEFEPTIGTWNYIVGDANYQVAFSFIDLRNTN